jgi:hypothetical protein
MNAIQETVSAKSTRKSKGVRAGRLTTPVSLADRAYPTLEEAQPTEDSGISIAPKGISMFAMQESTKAMKTVFKPKSKSKRTEKQQSRPRPSHAHGSHHTVGGSVAPVAPLPPNFGLRPPQPPPLRVTDPTPTWAPKALAPANEINGQQPTTPQPNGLDPSLMARWNKEATILENTLFPAEALGALGLDATVGVTTLRMYFSRFREKARASADPVERILLDHLVLTNLKIAEMHAKATVAKRTEHVQVFNNGAAKLLGCLCQLTSTLVEYRSSRRPCEFPLEFNGQKNVKKKQKNEQRTEKQK